MITHYFKTNHGTYVIVPLWECHEAWRKTHEISPEPKWEIFAPRGRNFHNAHSLLEYTFSDCKEHIGMATGICKENIHCCHCLNCNCPRCG